MFVICMLIQPTFLAPSKCKKLFYMPERIQEYKNCLSFGIYILEMMILNIMNKTTLQQIKW